MLFRQDVLERIERGEVRLAFRRWRRPTVRAGGKLRTSVGVLVIDAVEKVEVGAIMPAEARAAGFDSLQALRDSLHPGTMGGSVYRIRLRYLGADPRDSLRIRARITPQELARLEERLAQLDRRRAWALVTLRLIARRPGARAAELAEELGRELVGFKRDVRALKELGLTESLDVGYRLAPRGRALLARLAKLGR